MEWMKPCTAITSAGWKPPMSILITGGIQHRVAGKFTAWSFRTQCSKRYIISTQSGCFGDSTVQQSYKRGLKKCYNPAHHHKSPQDSVNAMADVYKTIFQTTRAIKPESGTQSCPCGTPPSLAWLPYMDQAVTADPVGAAQVRSRIKVYKALLGPEAAVYGDHVELSAMTRHGNDWLEHGDDFASTIGTGGVVGTKFVWPDPGPKFKAVNLTPEKDARWK